MAKQEELIYDIKNMRYSGLSSDDSIIADEQILHWVNVTRAFLAKRELEKNKYNINAGWVQDLGCVPVECMDIVDCCDLDLKSGCYHFRTVEKIPKPLFINRTGLTVNALLTYVGLVTKRDPFEFTTHSMAIWSKYKKYTAKCVRAFYLDEYVYIINVTNPDLLEYISILGVFENPQDVEDFETCEGDPCFTQDHEYPMPGHLIEDLNNIIFKKYLGLAMQPTQDTINDTQEQNRLNR